MLPIKQSHSNSDTTYLSWIYVLQSKETCSTNWKGQQESQEIHYLPWNPQVQTSFPMYLHHWTPYTARCAHTTTHILFLLKPPF
jgi:hypothetical protein